MEQKFLFQINLLQLLLLLQISLKNLSDFGSLLRIIQNSLGKDHPMCLTIRLGLWWVSVIKFIFYRLVSVLKVKSHPLFLPCIVMVVGV